MQQQEQKKRWHFFLRDSSSEEGRDLAKVPKGMMSTLCRVINGSPDRENKLQHEETVMYHHQCWEGITGNITSQENPCPSLFSRGDYMRCIFLLFSVCSLFLIPLSSHFWPSHHLSKRITRILTQERETLLPHQRHIMNHTTSNKVSICAFVCNIWWCLIKRRSITEQNRTSLILSLHKSSRAKENPVCWNQRITPGLTWHGNSQTHTQPFSFSLSSEMQVHFKCLKRYS